MAGQRAGLAGDALHHAAVAGERVGVVVDDRMFGGVELRREIPFRHRQAHGIGDPLAERSGRGLDAGHLPVFGVAGRPGAELAKILEVVERCPVTGQKEQRIQPHRSVTGRKHEAVPVDPVGRGRVVLEYFPVQEGAEFGQAERQAGVPGGGLLDRVDGKETDGQGRLLNAFHHVHEVIFLLLTSMAP